jgi:hypothetical protein
MGQLLGKKRVAQVWEIEFLNGGSSIEKPPLWFPPKVLSLARKTGRQTALHIKCANFAPIATKNQNMGETHPAPRLHPRRPTHALRRLTLN